MISLFNIFHISINLNINYPPTKLRITEKQFNFSEQTEFRLIGMRTEFIDLISNL